MNKLTKEDDKNELKDQPVNDSGEVSSVGSDRNIDNQLIRYLKLYLSNWQHIIC